MITAPFNNKRTLKFKAQPTNAFFATIINQMFGGSSQPPTTAEHAVIKSLCTVQTTKQCSAVVVSWEKPPNIWLTAAINAFVGRLLNFRVPMLLKSTVNKSKKALISLQNVFYTLKQLFGKHFLLASSDLKCLPPEDPRVLCTSTELSHCKCKTQSTEPWIRFSSLVALHIS